MPASSSTERVNVLGVGLSVLNQDLAREILFDAVRTGKRGYVTVTGVRGVIKAWSNPALRYILNDALLCTPDGMLMVWMGKMDSRAEVRRIYVPDLISTSASTRWRRGSPTPSTVVTPGWLTS